MKTIPNSNRVLLILALLGLLSSFVSYADVPLKVSPSLIALKPSSEQKYVLGPYLSYMEDVDGTYSLEQVKKLWQENDKLIQPNYDEVLNLGISESIFWLFVRLDFEDTSEGEVSQWFLELSNPMIKSSELFILNEGKILSHQIVGDSVEVEQKRIHRNFIFDVSNYNNSSVDLIFRIDSHSLISFPLTLWKPEALAMTNRTLEYWLGFYFGLMAVMAIYNFVIYFVIRDKSYLYYVAYILSVILLFLTLSGTCRQYIIGDISYWNERIPMLAGIIAMAFSLKFASAFVSLEKISRKLNRFVNAVVFLILIMGIVTIVKPFDILVPLVYFTGFYSGLLIFLIMYSRRQGSREAMILLVSFSVLIIFVFIYILSALGLAPITLVSQLGLYIGSAFHVIILSLGLANQINVERRKRYQALIRENQAVQNMRRLEERSLENALIDPLTSLPNRAALENFGKDFLQLGDGKKSSLVLALIHLESFQEINHTLGFRSSDLLLEKVASRLNRIAGEFSECITLRVSGGASYSVAKLGASSFVLLFRLNHEKQKYIHDIEHILALLNRPVPVHDMMIDVNARAGVSFSPEHSTNIFTLVRFAQAAVEAQSDNSSVVSVYTSLFSQQAARKLRLINDLRSAIKNNDLYLVFQPQLDIREHKIVSLETLIRWRHPEFGEVGPSEFVLLAEKTGLIDEMTEWVIHQAIESLLWLLEKGLKLRLAINISAKNLLQENFVKDLLAKLSSNNLNPNILTLEVTETSLMQNPEKAIRVLKELHKAGIFIAIDDFGSGYSSLAYIKQLPLSELKIDKSFVSQIDSTHSDRVITKSTIILAHEMGARVCAEGVESSSSLKILAQFDCDIAQGFHIAKPMTRENLLIWIDKSQFMT